MKTEWRNIKFNLIEFNEGGAYIISAIEPI
jgi:hypothetical protein